LSASRKFLRMMNPAHSSSGRQMPKGIIPKLAISFILLFVCLWFGIQANSKLNSEVVLLKDQCDKLRIRSKILDYQLSSMMTADKLETVAVARYGFKKIRDDQIIVVSRQEPLMDKIIDGVRSIFSRQKDI